MRKKRTMKGKKEEKDEMNGERAIAQKNDDQEGDNDEALKGNEGKMDYDASEYLDDLARRKRRLRATTTLTKAATRHEPQR